MNDPHIPNTVPADEHTIRRGLVAVLTRLHTEERGDVPGWVMITLVNGS